MTKPEPANPRTLEAALDLCVRIETEAQRLASVAGGITERFHMDLEPREGQLRAIRQAIGAIDVALQRYNDSIDAFEIPQSSVMGG